MSLGKFNFNQGVKILPSYIQKWCAAIIFEAANVERICITLCFRAVGRSENSGVPVSFGGHNLPPPLVEIGLTDLPKSGVAMAPPAPPGTTPLVVKAVTTTVVSN